MSGQQPEKTRERAPANLGVKFNPNLGAANMKRFHATVRALLKSNEQSGDLALAILEGRADSSKESFHVQPRRATLGQRVPHFALVGRRWVRPRAGDIYQLGALQPGRRARLPGKEGRAAAGRAGRGGRERPPSGWGGAAFRVRGVRLPSGAG